MKSFHGTFEELQTRVSATDRKGLWADLANGKQFRCDDGAILNWFPGTGRVQYQGPEVLREKLQTDLSVDLCPFPNENITTEAFMPTAVQTPRQGQKFSWYMGMILWLASNWNLLFTD